MRLLVATLALLAAASFAVPAAAQPAPQSRFTRINEARCPELPQPGEPDEVGDELGKRCSGLGEHHIWIYYFDSSRMRLGFGRRGNINGMFGLERNGAWPFEWRGRVIGGRFVPYAVIARVTPVGDAGPSELVVWKLTNDGMSCITDRIGPGPNQNQRARSAADRVLAGAECEAPPDPIDGRS